MHTLPLGLALFVFIPMSMSMHPVFICTCGMAIGHAAKEIAVLNIHLFRRISIGQSLIAIANTLTVLPTSSHRSSSKMPLTSFTPCWVGFGSEVTWNARLWLYDRFVASASWKPVISPDVPPCACDTISVPVYGTGRVLTYQCTMSLIASN